MSIIEEALRKNADHGHISSPRPRLRRRYVEAVGATPPRRFKAATTNQRTMEKNCILPKIWDPAALRAYKILRTRILRRLDANDWRSIAVSGMAPGEGKTLTAINLAMALAQDLTTRVFLVDLDLQRPRLAQMLGLSVDKGLSDYVAGNATMDDIIYESGVERLALIPNLHVVQQSSEFLASTRMAELVRGLEAESPRRIVIFDMPPLLAGDDVLAFAPQVDGLLMVVSEGETRRASLAAAREVLAEMNLVGVVLNRSGEANDGAYY